MKKAQVWVETAVYTLIGLTIIGILLAIVTPQIEKIKDKSLVEQTITALNQLDTKIQETEQTGGNIRIVDFKITKGTIEIIPDDLIESTPAKIIYTLENTKLELSQPDEEIQEGNIKIITEEFGARYKITLTLEYPNLHLTYNNQDTPKILQPGSQPHKIKIENIGDQSVDENIHIDFNLI